jgi:hypothetical protein
MNTKTYIGRCADEIESVCAPFYSEVRPQQVRTISMKASYPKWWQFWKRQAWTITYHYESLDTVPT